MAYKMKALAGFVKFTNPDDTDYVVNLANIMGAKALDEQSALIQFAHIELEPLTVELSIGNVGRVLSEAQVNGLNR